LHSLAKKIQAILGGKERFFKKELPILNLSKDAHVFKIVDLHI
jgi:hypothetical protein